MGSGSSSGSVVTGQSSSMSLHNHGNTDHRPVYYISNVSPRTSSATTSQSHSESSDVKYWQTSPRVWDEKRDTVYSRILAAEEFLLSMKTLDDDVRRLSQVEDRERHMPRITEALGLRGHLHGELLRIQRMLAEDDPTLKCISEYEISHADVVNKLRELHNEGSRIQSDGSLDAMTQVDLLLKDRGLTGISLGTNTDAKGQGTTVGIQNDGGEESSKRRGESKDLKRTRKIGTSMGEIDNEQDLKEKHDEEEANLAARYAKVIARGRQMSVDEINSLLSDHARSVQALRMKQEMERKELLKKLELKRKSLMDHTSTDKAESELDLNKSVNGKTSKSRRKRREKLNDDELSDTKNGKRKSQSSRSNDDIDANKLLSDHSTVLNDLRSMQGSERDRFQKLLQKKRAERTENDKRSENESSDDDGGDDDDGTTSRTVDNQNHQDSSLDAVVRKLEELRTRGELSDESLDRLLDRYYNKSRVQITSNQDTTTTMRRREHDPEKNQISVSQILEDTQAKQNHIKNRRQQEKDLVAEKLRQKLQSRNDDRVQIEED